MLRMTGAALLRRSGTSPADILKTLKGEHTMWTAPMPLQNAARLRVGHVKTDGARVTLSACGGPYGQPCYSFEAAAVSALGPMPPLLAEDWRIGIAKTLAAHGYSVRRDCIAA